MTTTMNYSGELAVVTCWCGIKHAVPTELRRAQQVDCRQQAYCPLGHAYVCSGPSRAERERDSAMRRAETAERRAQRAEERAQAAEYARRAEKAAKTRIKNRVAKGVCPCCNRHFANLAQHMKNQHPGFTDQPEASA